MQLWCDLYQTLQAKNIMLYVLEMPLFSLWRVLSSSSQRIPPDPLIAFSNTETTSNRNRTLNGSIFTSISELEPTVGVKKIKNIYIHKECGKIVWRKVLLDTFLSLHSTSLCWFVKCKEIIGQAYLGGGEELNPTKLKELEMLYTLG